MTDTHDETVSMSTNGNGNFLARFAIGISLMALSGLAAGLLQWGAWGAELEDVKEEAAVVGSDIRVIQRDIEDIKRDSAVQGYILRSMAVRDGIRIPPAVGERRE